MVKGGGDHADTIQAEEVPPTTDFHNEKKARERIIKNETKYAIASLNRPHHRLGRGAIGGGR